MPILPLERILKSCSTELDHKMGPVRNASLDVIGSLYHNIGLTQLVSLMAGDVMTKHKRNLDETFSKVETRKDIVSLARMGDKFSGAGKTCIASGGRKLLPKDIFKNLITTEGKNAWKERKIALKHA